MENSWAGSISLASDAPQSHRIDRVSSEAPFLTGYWKPSQLPKASEIMDLEGESIVTTF